MLRLRNVRSFPILGWTGLLAWRGRLRWRLKAFFVLLVAILRATYARRRLVLAENVLPDRVSPLRVNLLDRLEVRRDRLKGVFLRSSGDLALSIELRFRLARLPVVDRSVNIPDDRVEVADILGALGHLAAHHARGEVAEYVDDVPVRTLLVASLAALPGRLEDVGSHGLRQLLGRSGLGFLGEPRVRLDLIDVGDQPVHLLDAIQLLLLVSGDTSLGDSAEEVHADLGDCGRFPHPPASWYAFRARDKVLSERPLKVGGLKRYKSSWLRIGHYPPDHPELSPYGLDPVLPPFLPKSPAMLPRAPPPAAIPAAPAKLPRNPSCVAFC